MGAELDAALADTASVREQLDAEHTLLTASNARLEVLQALPRQLVQTEADLRTQKRAYAELADANAALHQVMERLSALNRPQVRFKVPPHTYTLHASL